MKFFYRVFEENKKLNLYKHRTGFLCLFSDWEFIKSFKTYKKIDKYAKKLNLVEVDIFD